MVYRKLAGIILCLVTLGFVLVTILWPQSVRESVELVAADGLPGTIQATFPVRGWSGDWSALTVEFDTSETRGYDEPLTIRAEVELFGGTEKQPQGSVSSVIDAGESALFTWRVRSTEAGVVNGTLWLFASESGGEEQLLYGREFSFISTIYGFLPPALARSLAVLFFVTGIFLILWRGNRMAEKNSRSS
jgi:hypothetical protein